MKNCSMRIAFVGLVAAGSAAQAQTTAAMPTGQADSAPAAVRLTEEILVTATRRAESVQKVPLSVDVVTVEELQSRNLTSAMDLPRLSPGLSFTNAGQANLQGFSVRGVSTYAFADTLEQTVGVNFDGVPVGRPGGSFATLVDIERVEILQGPQGLLFGKNASAGLVAVHSAKPKFDDSFSGRLALASRNEWNIEGTANMQLDPDRLALRVTGWSLTRDGYIKQLSDGRMINDRDDKGVRGRLRWEPLDALEVNLTAEHTVSDAECCAYTSLRYPAGSIWGAADAAQGIVPGFGNYLSGTPQKPGVAQNNYARSWNYNYVAQLDYDLGGLTLTSVSGLRKNREANRYDGTVSNIPFLNDAAPYEGHYEQFTQEIRLTSDTRSPFSYVVGAFYYDLDLNSRQTQAGCQPPGTSACVRSSRVVDVGLNSKSYALFGEATYRVTDAFRVSGGGRLSHDDVDGTFNRTALPGDLPLGGLYATAAKTDYTNFSGRVGAQYDLDPTKMLYVSYSTGYKGPGLGFSTSLTPQIVALTGGLVKPEIARSVELGLKTQWPDYRLTLNLALFNSTFRDFQTTVGLPGTFPPTFAVVNANEIRTRGAQADFTWRPLDGLELGANVAYTDAEFTDFANSACYREQTAATGCINGLFDVSGLPLTDAPEWRFNLSARYERSIGDWDAFYQVDYNWKDDVYWLAGNPFSVDESYGLLNMSAGVTLPNSHFRITAFTRNLLQEDTFGRVVVLAFGPGYVRPPTYDTQRVVGIALNVDF